MRRRTKLPIEPKVVLIAFSLICFVLIIVSFQYEEKLAPVKSFAGEVVTPMQKGINSVGTWFFDRAQIFTTMEKLIEENNQLKEELANISYENKILQQERYELDDLRKLYKLDEKYASYPKVAARVISRDSNNWYNQFCIDKGSKDGLSVNMNVIAGDGLVGIITEVGENWSKVRTIIDDKSNVSSMTLKSSDICNVKGNLELIDQGLIELELADRDADIKEGDEIVTSHISDRYLEGILIGYVNSISVDSSNMTQSGYLTPAVSFDSLDTVLVITELKKELPKEAITY
ncbi:rod shape-determining protein MreC [Acetivibrio ethanolgignens]|uniref:Cell shape-determining protein MreC n=1 Tax=Acetivibrio ethanolgignens TaxID=290052 RepID=A0A0V8QHA6_9FIRM|nr:rod shape-determining protein MreC [Acetivibrio ethanolgignens]KSV59943.1 rod shape-determining protein MreC [Acetivibrio ethanolgignens]